MKAFLPVRLLSLGGAVAAAFLIMTAAKGMNSFVQLLILTAALYVILAVSLNLVNGITGQFSLGHAAFYMVGAYSSGFLTIHLYNYTFDASTWPKWIAWSSKVLNAWTHLSPVPWVISLIFIGMIFAALAGLLVGLPSLRLRGDYLAIVTLGFGEIMRIIVQNTKPLGEAYGMSVKPEHLPQGMTTSPLLTNMQLIMVAWLLAFATIGICRNILQHVQGLAFLSIREDEVAANAMGVNTTKVKVTAFVLAAALAGGAGAILAPFTGFVTPAHFDMNVSVLILTMVVLGGTGSITGSVIAALTLFLLPEKMRDLKQIGMPTVLGIMLAVFAVVYALRWITANVHTGRQQRTIYSLAAVAGGFVLSLILAKVTGMVPAIAAKVVDPSPLRFVLNAFTLIILMLLRPQGLFGHHELSLSKLFGNESPTGAVK